MPGSIFSRGSSCRGAPVGMSEYDTRLATMLGSVVMAGSKPIGEIGVGTTAVGVTVLGMISLGSTCTGLISVGVIVVGLIGVGVNGEPKP